MHSVQGRFWAKVDKTDTCWLWNAGKSGPGYGRYRVGNFTWQAHRYSYLLAHAGIPNGLEIDHLCGQPSCVRPDHLEAVTGKENKARQSKTRKPRSHCRQGHPYLPENTGWRKDGRGRICLTCQRDGYFGSGPRNQRTHCPKGHPYSDPNLYVRPTGVRDCRACNSARHSGYNR